jgi:hypothetical protein
MSGKKLDNWNEIEENCKFDLRLESFSKGHVERFYLFGVKSLDNRIRLIFYIKNDLKDFFNLSSLDASNILSIVIDFSDYVFIIGELIIFLENNGVFVGRDSRPKTL